MSRMPTAASLTIALLVGLIAAYAGYWAGSRSGAHAVDTTVAAAEPGKKILYYRNPMGLPDTSPTPKKDPMGMDYIAVYEGDEQKAGQSDGSLTLSPEKIQRLGVAFAPAQRITLQRPVRAVGRVEPDERKLYTVAPKFEGWIERLHVNTTGQAVARGEPLFDAYSPELVSAQREYLLALAGQQQLKDDASMRLLAEASLARLSNWDIGAAELARLREAGELMRTLTLRAPASGIVMEKPAVQGMRFMPGEVVFRIADLSTVWVIADVFEQELALVRPGQSAAVRVNAYPERSFSGRVSYVYPTVNAEARTARVRIELANPQGLLKPAMYAEVEIAASAARSVIAVPTNAVLATGTRNLVLLDRGQGRFEPREVRLGARNDELIEIVEGLKEGERVVARANFLIDAESNLRNALATLKTADSESATMDAGHEGVGTVRSIDVSAQEIVLDHEPIASLKWPAMEMPFALKDGGLARGLRPGSRVRFAFTAQGTEYTITRIEPLSSAADKR